MSPRPRSTLNVLSVRCACGHSLPGRAVLKAASLDDPTKPVDAATLKSLLARLRCSSCGRRGRTTLESKPLDLGQEFKATANSPDSVFHRASCGWMGNVRLEDEITFSTAEEAVQRGYQPCKYCHPR